MKLSVAHYSADQKSARVRATATRMRAELDATVDVASVTSQRADVVTLAVYAFVVLAVYASVVKSSATKLFNNF